MGFSTAVVFWFSFYLFLFYLSLFPFYLMVYLNPNNRYHRMNHHLRRGRHLLLLNHLKKPRIYPHHRVDHHHHLMDLDRKGHHLHYHQANFPELSLNSSSHYFDSNYSLNSPTYWVWDYSNYLSYWIKKINLNVNIS